MNQERIGKFIQMRRKDKKLTQEQLAEKLGVSINAVSKWERGLCLMDMSLLKPLSEILDVSITEILNGEKVNKDEFSIKSEEILVNTINYQNDKNRKKENKYIFIICILAVFVIIALNFDSIFKINSIEYLFLMIIGVAIVFLGIVNFRGNISTIHWYNRRNVSKEYAEKYGKLMGIGTIIIGSGMIITGLLQLIFNLEDLYYILAVCLIAGIIIMIYSQFKYNKGIF